MAAVMSAACVASGPGGCAHSGGPVGWQHALEARGADVARHCTQRQRRGREEVRAKRGAIFTRVRARARKEGAAARTGEAFLRNALRIRKREFQSSHQLRGLLGSQPGRGDRHSARKQRTGWGAAGSWNAAWSQVDGQPSAAA